MSSSTEEDEKAIGENLTSSQELRHQQDMPSTSDEGGGKLIDELGAKVMENILGLKSKAKTSAERQREYRQRKKGVSTSSSQDAPESIRTFNIQEPQVIVKCEPETIPLQCAMSLVKNEEYDIESSSPNDFYDDDSMDQFQGSPFYHMKERAKSASERQRAYRMRKKATRPPKPPPKTPRERSRLYRERKKIVNAFIEYQLQKELQQGTPLPGTSFGGQASPELVASQLQRAFAAMDPKTIADQATQMAATPEFIAILQRRKRSAERNALAPHKPPPKTPAERAKLYRERKKVIQAYRQYQEAYPEYAGFIGNPMEDDDTQQKAAEEGGSSSSTEPLPEIPFVEVKSEVSEIPFVEVKTEVLDDEDASYDGASSESYNPLTIPSTPGPSKASAPTPAKRRLIEGVVDEFESAGANVTRKLARMSPVQAIYAESLISAVLRRGLLERLQEHTDICDNRCGRRAVLASQSHQVSTSHPAPVIKEEPAEDIA